MNAWRTKCLGDIAAVAAGNPAPQEESLFKDGVYPFFRTADAGRVRFGDIYESADYLNEKGIMGLRRYPKGTILFPKSGASTFLNHRVMLGVEGYVASHLATIVADEAKIYPRFLLYFLSTVSAQDLVQDHSYPSLNLPIISGIPVPTPPLLEQQRIAGLLDKAFAGLAIARANAEKNQENANVLFESHLDSMFSRCEREWTSMPLERVLGVQPQNGWSPPAANHSDSGTPVLTLSSVTGFTFRPDKRKFTSAPTDHRRNYWVKNGDFLITRSNTPELVGHVAIASGIDEPTIYPDLIMRMNPIPDRIITEFLYYQMRTKKLRKDITGRAQGANPTMKKISNGAVKSLPIIVPPISTQQSIVETLNALAQETHCLATLYVRKFDALEALKKSLLNEAFLGRLFTHHIMEAESVTV